MFEEVERDRGGGHMWKAWISKWKRVGGCPCKLYHGDLLLTPTEFFLQTVCNSRTFLGTSLSQSFSLMIQSQWTQKTYFSSSNIHISKSPYLFLQTQTCINQSEQGIASWGIFYKPSLCSASWIYFYFKDSYSALFSISPCVEDVFSSHVTERTLRLKAFEWAALWCKKQSGSFRYRAFVLVASHQSPDPGPDCLGLNPGSKAYYPGNSLCLSFLLWKMAML